MADRRVGGVIFLKTDGEIRQAKGSFTYNLGENKREAVVGADNTHGYKSTPQVAYIEGAITDSADLDLRSLLQFSDGTVTLELANEKVIVLSEAWYAADGNVTTDEGEIEVRFEGISAREVR